MYTPELESMLAEMGNDFRQRRKFRRGWQQSGTLFVGGGTPVSMQCDFGEEDTFTVGFQQPYVQTGTGDALGVSAQALVMWNVEGTYKPVLVSMVGGMSVTAAARGVKIIMSDITPTTQQRFPNYQGVGTDYNVSCQVARGTRGTTQVPPYFQSPQMVNMTIAAAAANQTIQIPTNGGVNSVYVTVAATNGGLPVQANVAVNPGDATVLIQSQVGTHGNFAQYDPTRVSWVPVPPGSTQVSVQNNHATNTLVFSMFFGVDG